MRRIVMFRGTACHAKRCTYSNGGTAILLLDAYTDKVIAVTTLNSHDVPADHVIVKDYIENGEMYQALVAAGIVEQEPWGVSHDTVVFPPCRLIAPVPEEDQFWEAVSVPAHKEG